MNILLSILNYILFGFVFLQLLPGSRHTSGSVLKDNSLWGSGLGDMVLELLGPRLLINNANALTAVLFHHPILGIFGDFGPYFEILGDYTKLCA